MCVDKHLRIVPLRAHRSKAAPGPAALLANNFAEWGKQSRNFACVRGLLPTLSSPCPCLVDHSTFLAIKFLTSLTARALNPDQSV